jgi:hypothetical protein
MSNSSIKNIVLSDELEFLGFALSDCTVQTTSVAAKYLRAVHRTALELAIQNQFGGEVGGFWLLKDQIEQLRKLPLYYSAEEGSRVRSAVEDYLAAQIGEFYRNQAR